MTTGVLARGALIASIYKRGVNFNSESRMGISPSALMNHISADVSRINTAAQWFVSLLPSFCYQTLYIY